MAYVTNKRIWKTGDIVIHDGDEPLHRHKDSFKCLMVVISVNGDLVKTRYINLGELRDERNPIKLKAELKEDQPYLFEFTDFETMKKKADERYDYAIRRIYTNNIGRLHDPEVHRIFIDDSDYYKADEILRSYLEGVNDENNT